MKEKQGAIQNLDFAVAIAVVLGIALFVALNFNDMQSKVTGYYDFGSFTWMMFGYGWDYGDSPTEDPGDQPPDGDMTAYPIGGPLGVLAKFPVVHIKPNPWKGPCHNITCFWLGEKVSNDGEPIEGDDADLMPDSDGEPNLNVTEDWPNLDWYDDGLVQPLNLTNCTLSTFNFTITDVCTNDTKYFNAWFDWNRDGDWDDSFDCGGGNIAYEHAVEDQAVGKTGMYVSDSFYPYNPDLNETWMRMTLSPNASEMLDDGQGPPYCMLGGETEDYYLTICIDNDGDGYNGSSFVGCGSYDCVDEISDCSIYSGDAHAYEYCVNNMDKIYVGAAETCNHVDDDCDGIIDGYPLSCSENPLCNGMISYWRLDDLVGDTAEDNISTNDGELKPRVPGTETCHWPDDGCWAFAQMYCTVLFTFNTDCLCPPSEFHNWIYEYEPSEVPGVPTGLYGPIRICAPCPPDCETEGGSPLPHWVQGKILGALDFEGDGDYIDVGTSNMPRANESQSIIMWYKIPSNPEDLSLFFSLYSTGSAVRIGFKDSSLGAWRSDETFLVNTTPPAATTWYHIAYTYNSSSGTHIFYINGIEEESSTTTPDSASVDPTDLYFAKTTSSETTSFDGTLDEIAIFNRTLTPGEVYYFSQSLDGGYCGTETVCPFCGMNMTNSTVLIDDMECNGTAINVIADNVTLDCDGHYIKGNTTGFGVHVPNGFNITIKNCTILNFSSGIQFNTTINSTVFSNKLKFNYYGLSLNDSNSSNFTGNNIYNNSIGMQINSSSDNIIYNNIFYNTSNVIDDGYNIWNVSYNCMVGPNIVGGDCIGGNYFSDYSGLDNGAGVYPHNISGDGIGDTSIPYNIGIDNGGDYLPLFLNDTCIDLDEDGYSTIGGACGPIDCDDTDPTIWENQLAYKDNDYDHFGTGPPLTICAGFHLPPGYSILSEDCNDSNPSIHPGAEEPCNNIDDDCDNLVDEGFTNETCQYVCINSGFNWSNNGLPHLNCCGNDANEDSPYQAAEANCTDGNDNDCDGLIDFDDTDCSCTNFDLDEDGYSTAGGICGDIDCNDSNSSYWQNLPGYLDSDLDSYGTGSILSVCSGDDLPLGYADNSDDCNDSNISIWQNITGFTDSDRDNYGIGSSSEICSGLSLPTGYASTGGDCNDTNSSINPGAPEVCNGVDDDCDAFVDEGETNETCQFVCENNGFNWSNNGLPNLECCGNNPNEDSPYQLAEANCTDGNDNDCDGLIDFLDANCSAYCVDNDLDGYSISGGVCGVIDCNDSNDEIWQNLTGYLDSDLDTYGTGSSLIICSNTSLPLGYANNSDDCNDSNSSINPGAIEICNNIDDNCSGSIDENLIQSCGAGLCVGNQTCNLGIWSNCSTYENDAGTCAACNASGEAVYDDTQDSDCPVTICSADGCGVGTCFPNIFGDYPDNVSNFCSAIFTCTANVCTATCETDNDNDNYSVTCGDCNDTNASINPGAAEICNHVDDNCNGTIDEGFDNDGDNFTICGLPVPDCDDTNSSIYPGALEILNGVDDDCDGLTDEYLCGNSICEPGAGENSNNCLIDCPLAPVRKGGGGGGGAFLTACYENWNCTDWQTCLPNGTQNRECFDINSCDEKYDEKIINRVYITKRPNLTQECDYVVLPNCNDRIQNQDETDVDCGGSICPRCRDGSKCINDNDCFDKCDPERGICYTSVLPEIVAPTPAPREFNILPYLFILAAIIAVAGGIYGYFNLDKLAFYQRYMASKHADLTAARNAAQEDKNKLSELQKQKREAVKELHKRLRKEYADKLEMFLERSINKGYKKSDIINALSSRGWPSEFVNKYVDAYFKEHHVWIKKMERDMENTRIFARLKSEFDHINDALKGKK